jgi:carbonic anhydrase
MPDSDLSRRGLLGRAGAVAAGAALGPVALAEALEERRRPRPHPRTPGAALDLLKRGNLRYRKGKLHLRDYSPVGEDRADDQKPFAAIITCADSRISPPLIFDVARGNIFVSRIAGNSIDTGTLGSTEYAVAVLGVKLIMVLGHSDCGAVKSAIGVANGTNSFPPDRYGAIGEVIDTIVPRIEAIPEWKRTLRRCTTANARAQAAEIAGLGPIIEPAIAAQKLRVVAAVYNIPNGRVRLV